MDMSTSMAPPLQANFVKSLRPVHGFRARRTKTKNKKKQETREKNNLRRNSLLMSGHQRVSRELMRQR